MKNPPRIYQKSTKIGLLEVLGELLEGSWVDLGLKSQNMFKKATNAPLRGNVLEAQNPPKSGKIGSKSDPKGDHFFDWLCGRVLVPFGTNLGPTWPSKSSQNRSKLVPKSIKKEIKMLIIFLLHFSSLWGRSCVNFPSKLEGRGSQKY